MQIEMASSERLELPTVRLEGACSIQLSYEDSISIITEVFLISTRGFKRYGREKRLSFAGWYIDKECTKRINPGGILPHTMSLYDKWIPIWYPVVYQTDGGMNSRKNPKYITIESGVIRLYPAKKQGKIFEGWYLDGKRVEYIPERQCQPVTLVAKYRDFNTVQFETFGGAIIPKHCRQTLIKN